MARDSVIIASAATRKALGIASSLRKILDVGTIGIFHRPHPYVFSGQFTKKVVIREDNIEKFVLKVLEFSKKNKIKYILPVRFVDVFFFARLRKMFEEEGIEVMVTDFERIKMVSDRVNLPQLFKGIASVPCRVHVTQGMGLGDVAEALGDLRPPLVVKGLGDHSSPSFHVLMEGAVREAHRRRPCVVEEFVHGIARGYFAVSHEGKPLLEYTHQRVVEEYPVGGPSIAAEGPVGDPALLEIGRRLLRRISWTGPIMVETKWDPATGEYNVLEINPKFWGSIDLPLSQGYHFPAVFASIYLCGTEFAEELALSLKKDAMRRTFVWLLDGMSYLAKIPGVWVKLLHLARKGGHRYSDLHPAEPMRWLGTVVEKTSRLPSYRMTWKNILNNSKNKINIYFKKLLKCLQKGEVLIALDLDGTIARFPVEWESLRERLVVEGIMRPWECLRTCMFNLWSKDRGLYSEVSKIVEKEELSAVRDLRPLVRGELLGELSDKGVELHIVTLQSRRAAEAALRRMGMRKYVSGILSRDDVGPRKTLMFSQLRERDRCLIAIDDDVGNLVDAVRAGYFIIKSKTNPYGDARAGMMGVPVMETERALKMILEKVGK